MNGIDNIGGGSSRVVVSDGGGGGNTGVGVVVVVARRHWGQRGHGERRCLLVTRWVWAWGMHPPSSTRWWWCGDCCCRHHCCQDTPGIGTIWWSMLLLGLGSVTVVVTGAVTVARAIAIIGQRWACHHLGWSAP